MKLLTRILITSLLSIGIALALSYLPYLQRLVKVSEGYQSVYNQQHPQILNSNNLVDEMSIIPLQLKIARIEINPSLLSIDLHAEDDVRADMIYRDLFEIVQFGLRGTSNIDQILVRVSAVPSADHAAGQLLLAMNAERDELMKGDKSEKADVLNSEKYLQEHFNFNYTPMWNRQFTD